MKDNFIITKLIKSLINDFDKYLTNFPNKEIEIKREIMNTSYNMLKICYEANTTYDINGCGIGVQTSHAFGLTYLNEICHFIKEELHIKYFINYMDDFIIIHHDRKYLNYCLDIIKDKLLNDYKLELNSKTRIYNINEGIEFLGYRYILKNNKVIIKLRNITKKNFKKNVRMLNLLKSYNYIDNEKYKLLLNGYKGVLSKASCSNLFRSIVYN